MVSITPGEGVEAEKRVFNDFKCIIIIFFCNKYMANNYQISITPAIKSLLYMYIKYSFSLPINKIFECNNLWKTYP